METWKLPDDDPRRRRRRRRRRQDGRKDRSVGDVTADVGYNPWFRNIRRGLVEDLGLARDCGHAAEARARLGESLMVKVEAANPSLPVEVSP